MNNPNLLRYLQFLQKSQALAEIAETQLTANQMALLESVVLSWFEGTPMSVRQAISTDKLGSPATLHKRLASLRGYGYIEEIPVEGDRRTKLLRPTLKTLEYFEKLGKALQHKKVKPSLITS